jgi:tetratricopeptide (TPR) repeat protein
LSKPSFLKSALQGAAGLLRIRAGRPSVDDLGHPDPEKRGQALFRRGRHHMRAGELETAVEHFDRAVEALPDFGEAISARAECIDMLGRIEAARPQYDQARRIWAGERVGMPDRSYIYRQQGRISFEVESYALAVKHIKTGSFPLSASGNALLARGRAEEALQFYEQALKFKGKDKDPGVLSMKGEALSALGRHRQAIEVFTASLKGSPRSPETLSGRAIALAAQGKIDKANADWRAQLELLPESQPAARACVALRLADYELALPELERAIKKAPDEPYWRLYRLTALKRLGRPIEGAEPPAGDAWPAPLFALLAGQATPEAVLEAATNDCRRTEALFQMEKFREVTERAAPTLIEYAAARNELTRRR